MPVALLAPEAPSLLLNASLGLASAAVYGYVGRLMARRVVHHDGSRLAMRLFAVWWYGVAVFTLLGVAPSVLAAFGLTSLPLQATLAFAALAPLCAALWGLLFYLLYIYTGNRRLIVPLGVAHVGIYAFFTYVLAWLQPVGVIVDTWQVRLAYANELQGPVRAATLLALLGPVTLAALAYGSLYFRTRDRTSHYRVLMVAGAFLFWFGSAALANTTRLGQLDWWPPMSRAVGLIATLIVLAAYRPPRWLAQRAGIAPVALASDEAGAATGGTPSAGTTKRQKRAASPLAG